jgi:uncharacterized protein (DUF4415 family)
MVSAGIEREKLARAEYEEASEFTREMLDRAEIRHGDKIIRRGRPPLENPKEAVKLRLDHDVLAAYRKTGSGWSNTHQCRPAKGRAKAGGLIAVRATHNTRAAS